MDDLAGRVAVVTGAASGIGNALARRFAAEGMRLVLADVEQGALDEAVEALRAGGADAFGVRTDVADAASVDALAAATLDHYGAVHLVCNNAGVGGAVASASWELPLAEWEWVLGVNLWGVIHGMRAFLPHLVAADDGHVVNTASFAGLRPMPTMAPYSASKHGVVALTEAAFHELRARNSNVGISVLCPAPVATRIADSFRNRPAALGGAGVEPTPDEQEFLDAIRMFIAAGMPADEVADLVLDAVRTRRFWILTHEQTRAGVRDRAARIADGLDPLPGV